MEFQYLIYKIKELEHNGRLLSELQELTEEAAKHGVLTTAICDCTIPEYLEKQAIKPEEVLVIVATDKTLQEMTGFPIANVGYLNLDYPDEELYQADILVESFEEVDYAFLERIYQRKHHIPWRVIETKRCYLQEMTTEDLPDLYRLYAGEGMTDYMEPLSEWEEELAYTKAYIENMYRFYGYGMWLVKDRDTNELIGRAGLNNLELKGVPMLEMGYAIDVSKQRQGYAAEVCKAVIEYARAAETGYEKLYCFVQKKNTASKALLKRLEFVFQGYCIREDREMELYELLLI